MALGHRASARCSGGQRWLLPLLHPGKWVQSALRCLGLKATLVKRASDSAGWNKSAPRGVQGSARQVAPSSEGKPAAMQAWPGAAATALILQLEVILRQALIS